MEVKPGLRRRRGIARWTRSMAFNTSARWGFQFRLAGIYLTRNWCWGRVKLDLVNCAWLISRPCKGSLLFACSEAWKNWIHQSSQGRCWSKNSSSSLLAIWVLGHAGIDAGFDQWKRLNDENEGKHNAVIFHNLWSKFCRSKKIKARPKDGKVFKERRDSNWWDDRRMVGRRLNAPPFLSSVPRPSHPRSPVPSSHRPVTLGPPWQILPAGNKSTFYLFGR